MSLFMMYCYDCLRFPAVLVMLAGMVPCLDLYLIPLWCRNLCVSLSAVEMPLLWLSTNMSWVPQCGTVAPSSCQVLWNLTLFRSFVACLPYCFLQTEVQEMGQLLTTDVIQTLWKSKQTSLLASLGFGQTPCCNSFG